MDRSERDETAASGQTGGTQTAGRQTAQVVIQQGSSSFFMRLLALLGWVGFLFCGLWAVGQLIALGQYFDTSGGISEKFHSGSRFGSDKIAVLHVTGVIAGGDGYVKRQIDRVQKDDDVKAVVVRVVSPGGTITGSDYIFHHLNKLREEREIPLVVSMGSIAASGGYYVSMCVGDQEKSIYAEPTTTTGSIGVIIPHYDISGLLEQIHVRDDSIATHPRKQMLSMTRPISDEHRAIIEEYIGEAFTRFKDVIKIGRPKFREQPALLDELATGQVFTANQAKQNGLIDDIGFIEAAIERATELAGLDADKVRVVEFEKPVSLVEIFGLAAARHGRPDPLSNLREWSVPVPYYLFTSLSPLAASWQ